VSRRNVIPIDPGQRAVSASPMERALLPWEDKEDFLALRAAFHREHQPQGPTETSLVDQLVWLDWRRRRLVVGERAVHMAALQERLTADYKSIETVQRAMLDSDDKADKDELASALSAKPAEDGDSLADAETDEAMTRHAIAILETGDPHGYDEALATVREDTAGWWQDVVGDDEETHSDGLPHPDDNYQPYARNREQLLRFLKTETMPIFTKTRGEIARRPAIRLQAQGESLDPFRMDRILVLDERLTRQFEKTLAMLVRLGEMRQRTASPARA
jgi:hypothetical protein